MCLRKLQRISKTDANRIDVGELYKFKKSHSLPEHTSYTEDISTLDCQARRGHPLGRCLHLPPICTQVIHLEELGPQYRWTIETHGLEELRGYLLVSH
jgi:hypothetical protein